MTLFLIVVVLMIAGALLFIVPPLLGRKKEQISTTVRSELNVTVYRDQLRELDAELAAGALSKEEYQSARSELEGRVLEDSATEEMAATPPVSNRKLAIAAAVAVPVLTVSLYLMLGKPAGLDPQNVPAETEQQVTQEQIVAMVEKLAQRLKEKPDDAEGWMMLARSYLALRRFNEAADAYSRAAALMPNNAQLLADYADILAVNNGRNMLGEPEKIIRQALQADPNNVKALALMGTASFQHKDYRAAIEWWRKLLQLVPADSQIAASINANISQAEGLSGQPIVQPQAAPTQSSGSR
ncbi:MAG: c-type cytochrome biogenesis protein CcmI [Nitrosomonadales bacterium]|nr:c-type cytochrome biogenesis protein CcmI [Nitrosomonadales bacterium]